MIEHTNDDHVFFSNKYYISKILNVKTKNTIDLSKVKILHDNLKHFTNKDPFYKFYINGNKITKLNTYIGFVVCKKCNKETTFKLSKIQYIINKNNQVDSHFCSLCEKSTVLDSYIQIGLKRVLFH